MLDDQDNNHHLLLIIYTSTTIHVNGNSIMDDKTVSDSKSYFLANFVDSSHRFPGRMYNAPPRVPFRVSGRWSGYTPRRLLLAARV
jgi:hypothetical protein